MVYIVFMKGCIILFGESFRLGGQNTRNRGSDESYNEQIQASQSQMSFIKHLYSKNVNAYVYISSYETKFNNELCKVYADVLIGCDFYDNLIGQEMLIKNTINQITIEKFDFVLFMRIDLFIKNYFLEIFNPQWDKIMWPSICFKPYHKCGIHPRVNDMMGFFPRKYYSYFKYLYYNPTGHDQWAYFVNNTDLNYDCLDTMINTFHDSDSEKDFNPLYYIVNRPESKIHHNKGDIFNKFVF